MTVHTPIFADQASLQWNERLQSLIAARADVDAFRPIARLRFDEWERTRPSMDEIHWVEFAHVKRDWVARVMDLDEAWENFLAGENRSWWVGSPEARERALARTRAALDSVQAFRDAEARHEEESGWGETSLHEDELNERYWELETELMATPAPHLPALLWKLEKLLLIESDGFTAQLSGDSVAQTMVDARRLLAFEPEPGPPAGN